MTKKVKPPSQSPDPPPPPLPFKKKIKLVWRDQYRFILGSFLLAIVWFLQTFIIDSNKDSIEEIRRSVTNYWKYQSDLRLDDYVIDNSDIHKDHYKDTSLFNSNMFTMVWNQTLDKTNAIYALKVIRNAGEDSAGGLFYDEYAQTTVQLFKLLKSGHNRANDSALHFLAETKDRQFKHLDFDAQAESVKHIVWLQFYDKIYKGIAIFLVVVATSLITFHQAFKFYKEFKSEK